MATTELNYSEVRMKRGLELLEKGTKINEKEDGSFTVPSLTNPSIYEVRLIESVWVCSCPDFENRQVEACKHVYAVRSGLLPIPTFKRNQNQKYLIIPIHPSKCKSSSLPDLLSCSSLEG